MPIRVKCGGCKKTLSVKDHLAGKKIKCPVCQNVVAVSASAPVAAPPKAAGPAPKSAAPPKKPGAAPKPGIAVKAPPDRTKSNGPPAPPDAGNSNGVAPPPAIDLPPENVEAEALAAFADEPKPAEEAAEPQFIEYKCDWCDELVKQPIDLAGKQAQCPNPECRRVVKVPLPKKAEKKDWKKMDVKGPAAAIINQPEQLENAWGTEVASKARQSSLAQAGAIAEPVKPSIGLVGWMFRAFYGLCALAVLTGLVLVGLNVAAKKQQHNALADAKKLVEGTDPKIKHPLLAAEAHRTIGLLYLQEGKAVRAREDHLQGAQVIVALVLKNPKYDGVNEELFLIDLALSQIELGGSDDDILTKTRVDWEKVRGDLAATLGKIRDPEVQAMALRDIGSRLAEKGKMELAVGLSAGLSNPDAKNKRPAPFRQQIALRFVMPNGEADLKQVVPRPDPNDKKELADGNARVGYAEGLARKGDLDEARGLAKRQGAAKDRLDANIGIAAICWRKNRETASECLTDAIPLLKDSKVSDWQKLQTVRLAARLERTDEVKDLFKGLKKPFELRAHLEVILALCERSSGPVGAESFQELEAADKEGVTLALAWMALAQHNARKGASREKNRATFEDRIAIAGTPPELADKLRPMVDIGTYLGGLK